MPNLYATLAQLKAHLNLSDSDDDAKLIRILEAVSRQIDQHCERRFYTETRTRVYTARSARYVRVDDLLSVTSLKTDLVGLRTYELAWSTSDYDLDPANAAYESPPQPYSKIAMSPWGAYCFPAGLPRGVQVTGTWGYFQAISRLTATASAIGTTTTTSVTVSAGAEFGVGQTLLIDAEQLYVSAVSGTTLTVERGVNGTTPATHGAASPIDVYTYPVINEACLYQAALDRLGGANPGGLAGGGDFEQPIRAGGLHPFVKRMLEPFCRVEAR